MATCRTPSCTNTTWGIRDFCSDCIKLRVQHGNSHTIEGHPQPIKGCPVCEKVHG